MRFMQTFIVQLASLLRPSPLRYSARLLAALVTGAFAWLVLVSPALAQNNSEITKPPVLPKLEPLPEPPPPPPGYELDPKMEPQVVKIQPKAGERERNEYRINGRLYMIRVVPENGTPYFLVDDLGQGIFVRHGPAATGLRVPTWVLFTF
jgi:Protein of unknown function (DUF2782)